MIEIDIFGTQGKDVIKFVKEIDSAILRKEELPEIPKDYIEKGFVGRFSFSDEDALIIKEAISVVASNLEYLVVKGYFPNHIDIDYPGLDPGIGDTISDGRTAITQVWYSIEADGTKPKRLRRHIVRKNVFGMEDVVSDDDWDEVILAYKDDK